MIEAHGKNAVVLVSGGLDSATVLAMAQAAGYRCYTLSFDYGQRHRAELLAAERVAKDLGAEMHKVVRLDLGSIGGSALTDSSIQVPEQETEGIPLPMCRRATRFFWPSPWDGLRCSMRRQFLSA